MVFAPIVIRQFGNPFPGHGAGQKPRSHRRVNDDADVFKMAEGQNLLYNVAADQGVWGLERRNRCDALGQLHLFDIEVGNTDPTALPLLLELCHGRPAFFEFRRVVHGPMDLVKVNGFDLQPAQAILTLAANRIRIQHLMDLSFPIPTQTAFGEDIRTWPLPTRQGAGHDLLRGAGAIDGRGIYPVDSQFQRAMNRRDGRVIILRSPGELPTRATDGPGPEAHGSDE